MKFNLKNHPTCSKCQFYCSPSFVCPVADKVSTVANPKCPMIGWFVEFEKELRAAKEVLEVRLKDFDFEEFITSEDRTEKIWKKAEEVHELYLVREILGETSTAVEGSRGG